MNPLNPDGGKVRDGLDRLDYPRFREVLAGLATSFPGREQLERLHPFGEREEADRTLARVDGLRACHDAGRGLPPLEVGDLRPVFRRLGTVGSVLDAEAFLELRALLVAVDSAAGVLAGATEATPELRPLAEAIRPLPHLSRAVDETFDIEGTIRDTASPGLRRIRRELSSRREQLRTRMERLATGLSSPEEDVRVTLREGRYVLAVPQGQKGKVPGVVQDRSGSGATFFIEPLQIVDENNHLRELLVEEREEVRRILAQLTDRFRGEVDGLAGDWERVGDIDGLRARVLLARRWKGERPRLVEDRRLVLRGARHPLLLEGRLEGKNPGEAFSSVIPLDLELDGETRILVLTGPNMGGKTVALGTVGLLSAMAQSGCFIPAAPGCTFPWLSRWVVSVGDEQDLAADLSTFAGHLARWGEALAGAGPRTLVLLDELGSGTDPVEGAALAQSVMERLAESGSMGMVTTHLGTLKGLASSTDGLANASMVFDPGTRQPTYSLAVGIPGESHAIDMARRLGFPEERVARAEELLPREERDLKRLLAELGEERERLRLAREEAEQQVVEATRMARERRAELERVLTARAEIRSRTARQAREMLRRAEETVRRAEREAKEKHVRPGVRRPLVREQVRLARLEAPPARPRGGSPPEVVQVGESYWAEVLGREVEVVREPDDADRVMVVQGGVRVELPRTALRVLEKAATGGETRAPAPTRAVVVRPEAGEVPLEIDLRGLRVDESLEKLDRALDRALLAGLRELRVIHGKGTGALREAVHEYCRSHAAIQSAEIADQWEGGTGATVIRLEA